MHPSLSGRKERAFNPQGIHFPTLVRIQPDAPFLRLARYCSSLEIIMIVVSR